MVEFFGVSHEEVDQQERQQERGQQQVEQGNAPEANHTSDLVLSPAAASF